MTYYRSQRQREAVELFRLFIAEDDGSRDVAIAQHLVAHWECQHGSSEDAAKSGTLFRKSLKSGVIRGDKWHQAQVKHSMALCIAKQRPKAVAEAIELLESSLALLADSGDEWGRAKVLHSLGQILTAVPRDHKRARSYLEESRAIGLKLGYRRHVRLVEGSLRALRARRPSESTRRRLARKGKATGEGHGKKLR